MAQHDYSAAPWYVSEADGYIRVRQESSDAVLATMDDGGHPDTELVPFNQQLGNAMIMAVAPRLMRAAEVLTEHPDMLEFIERESTGQRLVSAWHELRAAIAAAEQAPA
jgi:hypothetical protein